MHDWTRFETDTVLAFFFHKGLGWRGGGVVKGGNGRDFDQILAYTVYTKK